MPVPFDVYAFVRAWEEKLTTPLPRPEEWPAIAAKLEAIIRAASEALRHGDSIYNPPAEHGEIATP